MVYRLAIFDFDGTLADSAAWTRGVLNQVAERFRFRQLSDAEFAMLRGRDSRAIVRYLGVPAWKIPLIARHMRMLAGRDASKIPLFPGTADLLRTLQAHGVSVAVVSSNSEANVRQVLGAENAALVPHFACGAAIFGKAAKFRQVLRRSGVPGAETICIGDETRDIEAARDAGLAAAAVSWGYATPELLRRHQPTFLFEHMDEIAPALIA
ncbi:HAD hydrolase-like protein [Rhodospirillaceae bacterium SYSU D60014]|uniref:HAD hydrolase-like protein n=1 Tax=Virgifigura deserti TaxID=2268457 RepID=UPI000E667BA4